MNAFAHCERLVREIDKDRFLATLFAPAKHRPALYALYAFDIEVARVPTLARQAIAGEIRLQWWREVLEGQRNDEASANPVAAALLATLDRYALAREPLINLVDARTFDLYDDPFATLAELEAYAGQTDAAVLTCAASILGNGHGDMPEVARPAATAVVVCHILRTFPARVSRGQLPIPLELLDRHRVQARDVLAGRSSKGLFAALADMRTWTRERFTAFANMMAAAPAATVPAFLTVALVPLYLSRMERPDYDPFRMAIEVPQWRRQWALWRAARTWGR
jgi:phytoene synthase